MKTAWIYLATLSGLILGNSIVYGEEKQSVAVTIYNGNFSIIRENRILNLKQGLNTLRFVDVATTIDPTSVSFKCIEKPDQVRILEQNYEYDLVNTASLLNRYIDKKVDIWVKGSGRGSSSLTSGILNAAVGKDFIVQKSSGQLEIINGDSIERVALASRPDDLITRPTLVWLVRSQLAGNEPCQITYAATDITWKADYTAIIADDEQTLDLSGWVTIDNRSGTAYRNAKIKLIAGDVRRVQPERFRKNMPMMAGRVMEAVADDSFKEKSFMDYHMYTLGRPSTVNNNQTKQIEFIEPVHNIVVHKKYVYETAIDPWLTRDKNKVKVVFEFKNTQENGLGIALPKGKMRTFKKDPADDALEFVGEDMIDHTPRKELIKLYIGDAFDIVGEQKSTDQKARTGWRQTTRKITVKNRKTEPSTVCIDEKFLHNRSWEISANNTPFEKIDAWTARFTVDLEADSEKTVYFTVSENW